MTNSLLPVMRFGIVGVLATCIHVAVFFIFVHAIKVSPTVATIPAFFAALLASYRLNHTWTFGARGQHAYFFIRYFLVTLLGLALNISIMYFGTNVLHRSYIVCLALVLMVVPAFNFLCNKYWGFVENQDCDETPEP